MKRSLLKSLKPLIFIDAILLISIAAVLVIMLASRSETDAAPTSLTNLQNNTGAAYIMAQEAVPVAPIEEAISAEEEAVLKESEMQTLLEDPTKVFENLNATGTILVGESRTAGFSAYGFMDENHVLGGIGWSIQEIPSLYGQIASLSPKNIVFCFGINELGRYPDTPVYYYSPEIFTGDLDRFIADIKELVPNINIFINCIVPCTEAVYQEFPGYAVIPEWNRYLENHCKEMGYGYIDISDLCAQHQEMYREDGTHLIADFYPLWGSRILTEVVHYE